MIKKIIRNNRLLRYSSDYPNLEQGELPDARSKEKALIMLFRDEVIADICPSAR